MKAWMRGVKGSYTIEISLLMPIIIGCITFAICGGMHQYQKGLLRQICARSLLQGSSLWMEEGDYQREGKYQREEERTKEVLEILCENRFPFACEIETKVVRRGDTLEIETYYQSKVENFGFLLGLNQQSWWQTNFSQSIKVEIPAEKIRKRRIVEERIVAKEVS